jgi:hypothetical protein
MKSNPTRYLQACFLIALVSFFTGCNAAQESAFLTDAPAIISGALASGNELAAAYSAAQQIIGTSGGKLNVTTGLAAANAAFGSATSTNLPSTVGSVFTAINQLGTDLKAANPAATTAQVANAQTAAVTAAQVALQVAAPAGSAAQTTACIELKYDRTHHALAINIVKTWTPARKEA